jgi:hypothetical protein
MYVKAGGTQGNRLVAQVVLDCLLLIGRHREDIAESATAEDDLLAHDFRIGYRGPWIYLRCSDRGDVWAS